MTIMQASDLANAVMGKLYDVLTNGDDTVPKSKDNFFSWMTPGMPFDPSDFDYLVQGLTGVVRSVDAAAVSGGAATGTAAGATASANPAAASGASTGSAPAPSTAPLTPDVMNALRAQDTNRVYMQAEMVAHLCDFVPEVSSLNNKQFSTFNIANNEGTLSDRYQMILRTSQVMSQELDDATKAKIEKFRGLLQTATTQTDLVTGAVTQVMMPSPMVQAYHTKMAAYDAAALQYNSARISALAGTDPAAVQNFAINANILRDSVKAAMDDWITTGYKTDYEEIAAYIDQVQQRDLKLLKAQYEDDLTKATLTGISSGSDFFFTSLIPGSFAKNQTGWSKYTFSSGDFQHYAGSKFDASGWSVKASGGFFGIGASGGGSHDTSMQSSDGSTSFESFNLSFEIAQIPIVRPWFKEAFIVSKAWRFDPTDPDAKAQGDCVNDGGSPPKGMIPAYPTTAIFIRNLRLNIDKSSSGYKYLSQATSSAQGGGATIGFGPISFGGSASHYSKSGYAQQNINSKWDDNGLSVNGLQLIGFKCHVFPKSPDPAPNIQAWV